MNRCGFCYVLSCQQPQTSPGLHAATRGDEVNLHRGTCSDYKFQASESRTATGERRKPIRLLPPARLFVDESGFVRRLAFNRRATFVARYHLGLAGDPCRLVGDAVVVGLPSSGGESMHVPDEVREALLTGADTGSRPETLTQESGGRTRQVNGRTSRRSSGHPSCARSALRRRGCGSPDRAAIVEGGGRRWLGRRRLFHLLAVSSSSPCRSAMVGKRCSKHPPLRGLKSSPLR